MALDPAANFVRGSTDAAIDATQTTVSVVDASIFPDPATEGEYNVVIWDVANNPRPDQDPDVEILRVTAIDTGTNTLTVVRAQEGTTGASHPSGSAVHLSPTAKMFSDIQTKTQGLSDDGKSLNIGESTSKVLNGEVFAGHPDFATVQDAIDYAVSNSIGTVVVPDGTYGPVTVKRGITLKGTGIYRDVDSIGPVFDGGTSEHAVTLESDTACVGIGARTTAGGGSSFDAFYDDPDAGDGTHIHGCAVLDSDNHGISIDGLRFSVTDCVFQATDGDSVFIATGSNDGIVDSNLTVRSITNNGGSNVVIGDNA